MKSDPLLVLASELQEFFDNFDYTLSSYLSVKEKLHSSDGKAFYLGMILAHLLVLNSYIYVCIFSVPFVGICSGGRTLSLS